MFFNLTIILPLAKGERAPAGAAHRMVTLTIECDANIDWVRKHADEIAQIHTGGADYVALNVSALGCENAI